MSGPSRLENYFDNAATTPLDPRVREAMLPWFGEQCGNPHSLHAWGMQAREAVDRARQYIADQFATPPEQVFFTSGATEANNWALQHATNLAVSPFEHSSVWAPAEAMGATVLANEGYKCMPAPAGTEMQAVMVVGNETGAVLGAPSLRGWTHRDATQALGKVPIDLISGDSWSCSAHKLGGPKGVGALVVTGNVALSPWMVGGGQEMGMRAGTLNVPGIVGFATALRLAKQDYEARTAHVRGLRAAFAEAVAGLPDSFIHEHDRQSPWILTWVAAGIEGETLVLEADARGFAIGAGAACSAHSNEPSRTLVALGWPPEHLRSAVRISFGPQNTVESVRTLAAVLKEAVNRLRG
ncbi:hypothetical protein CCB81_11530 [Armatimonadetes bacterium Uphvl-Ar2]|nr:hypothetical protein CCB81_11530 [Armatimonadetes bacterium Uphvl-Ar2]